MALKAIGGEDGPNVAVEGDRSSEESGARQCKHQRCCLPRDVHDWILGGANVSGKVWFGGVEAVKPALEGNGLCWDGLGQEAAG